MFTPDGKFYLEASGSTNVVEVISTSTFTVVNTINLPASGSPGLADMELDSGWCQRVRRHARDSDHRRRSYLISLATASTTSGPSGSIALTTAPAFAIPISAQYGTYLAETCSRLP